jgi:hypothetical protein
MVVASSENNVKQLRQRDPHPTRRFLFVSTTVSLITLSQFAGFHEETFIGINGVTVTFEMKNDQGNQSTKFWFNGPLTCYGPEVLDNDKNGASRSNSAQDYCCASWEIPGDDWWLHHPDWEESYENDTHYCFSPITDAVRAKFMRDLHAIQWPDFPSSIEINNYNNISVNCSDIETSPQINSGFGASTAFILNSLFHANIVSKKPFQIAHTPWR